MSTFVADPKSNVNSWLYPVIADVLGVVLFLVLNRFFEGRFTREAIDFSALTDAFALALPYILFLFGVHRVRQLDGFSAEFLSNRLMLGLIAVPFAFGLTSAIADLTGYLSSIFTVDFGDMGNGYYFLTTPAVYLFFTLLYFFVLIQPIESPKAPSAHLAAALVAINLFAVAVASYLNVTLIDMAFFTKWLLIFGLLLFFFALPRIIYYVKTRSWISVVSFDVFLLAISVLAVQ
ncbi:MAG: hypothetical protein ACPG8W_11675 [Candidatus Promineifilaceae bacterium]